MLLGFAKMACLGAGIVRAEITSVGEELIKFLSRCRSTALVIVHV